tara:strand:+ start:585 stop:1019 length:435 start_codon:yes stop_codon:yes gene_type:complete
MYADIYNANGRTSTGRTGKILTGLVILFAVAAPVNAHDAQCHALNVLHETHQETSADQKKRDDQRAALVSLSMPHEDLGSEIGGFEEGKKSGVTPLVSRGAQDISQTRDSPERRKTGDVDSASSNEASDPYDSWGDWRWEGKDE